MPIKRKYIMTVDLLTGESSVKEWKMPKRDADGRFHSSGKARCKRRYCKFANICPIGIFA